MGSAFITRRGGSNKYEAIYGVTSAYANYFRLSYDATKTYIVTAYFSNNGNVSTPNEMATWLVDSGKVTPLGYADNSSLGFVKGSTPYFTCVLTDASTMTVSNSSSTQRHMGVMMVEVS